MLKHLDGAQPKGRNPRAAFLGETLSLCFRPSKGQVTCHICQTLCIKFGSFQNKNRLVRRYRCKACDKTFSESQPLDGVRLESKQAVQIVRMLAEGCGVRVICRLLGVNAGTVHNVLEATGKRCEDLLADKLTGLSVEHVECDELFGFVACLQQNTFVEDQERGDQYTFLASDRKTKLVIAHMVAKRTKENTAEFLKIVRDRVEGRFSMSTDAFAGYSFNNVHSVFGHEIDFGRETKFFAQEKEGPRRYNPKKVLWVKREVQIGSLEWEEINTSHAERLNLSYRLFNKRLARKTLGYSKTIESFRASVALTTAHFNFCRVHSSLEGKTPAMAAGITDHVWKAEELLGLSEGKDARLAA